jgi:hypothetical protein
MTAIFLAIEAIQSFQQVKRHFRPYILPFSLTYISIADQIALEDDDERTT